jgi:putative PIN family toxin of toxin-antitoxin system
VTTRVVLDTNVIISAYLNAGGNPASIRAGFREHRFEVVVSSDLLGEYEQVLAYPRLTALHGMSREEIRDQIEGIRRAATLVRLGSVPHVIQEDPDDDIVLATAIAGEAEYIVSGDEHLRRLGIYQGIRVVSPAAFVALLES